MELAKNQKIYSGVAGRILKLLSTGQCTQQQAADACGVDKSYVSQLMHEEDFVAQIQQSITEETASAIEFDKNISDVELLMSQRLKQLSPMIMSVKEIKDTLRLTNGLKKKIAIAPGQAQELNKMAPATLILPQVVINNFVVNPNNEIVRIGERDLNTLNSSSITALANKFQDAKLIEDQTQPVPKIAVEDIKNVRIKTLQREDKWSNL